MFGLPDPRTVGSNNAGATNVLRIGGKKLAIMTLFADALKGFLPVFLMIILKMSLLEATLVLFAALLGHIYPIFFGFRGGKGVATFLGGLLALNYFVGLIFIAVWLFVAKILKISSLSALIATAITPLFIYFIIADVEIVILNVLIGCLIFWTHRSNIRRLFDKEETKI
ncbi:Acyl-phosphate:glycerol-3-phosphate O-acyltransferase PlsY [hydrothermal vent metagenome]|uniref:Acyl-phosphate:glycerol-3-phosphate O-acyltransferase PlsY n=1 Tax=hydrothermal vent metagenome TaxID=652676 RepID=A0A1W1CN66_9ZZZZ